MSPICGLLCFICHCNPCLCTQPWCGRLNAAFLVQGLQCLPCCCELCYYTVTYACLCWIYFSAITCCAVHIMQGTLSHVLQSLGMHIAVAPSQPIFVMCLSLVLMAFQHHVVHLYCRRAPKVYVLWGLAKDLSFSRQAAWN